MGQYPSKTEYWRMNMLVLSRRQGEHLMIGDGIVVTVLEVRGNRVRVGIDAGSSSPISRHEIYRSRLEGERPLSPPAHATTA
jgi:carbon storage regulator